MRPVFILTSVGFICPLLLAMVNEATQEPIRLAQESQKRQAIESLFDFPISMISELEGQDAFLITGRQGEKAHVLVASTIDGYSGLITAVVGVKEGVLQNYRILIHTETPGLGDKIAKEGPFKAQFSGKSLEGYIWKVKKDGGQVDALTAATISSRAISHMLEKALHQAKALPTELPITMPTKDTP